MSGRARKAIECADTIAGYTTYIDLVRPLIAGKTIISTGMQKEVERVWQSIEAAEKGASCALVCSGDPGIYAMAGLVFELCRTNHIAVGNGKDDLFIEVVPGVPALCAGAALLGAPLMHDFASISLSDLLTPWEVIEKRIFAAAMADFVIAFYNPKSKKRNWQLDAAKKILLDQRFPDTPVGLVTSAMRDNQSVHLCTLENLDAGQVGMQTIVFVGNSSTFIHDGRMVTPRGYDNRYNLKRQDDD
jgi:precorrin-3B C17-methyltransferase